MARPQRVDGDDEAGEVGVSATQRALPSAASTARCSLGVHSDQSGSGGCGDEVGVAVVGEMVVVGVVVLVVAGGGGGGGAETELTGLPSIGPADPRRRACGLALPKRMERRADGDGDGDGDGDSGMTAVAAGSKAAAMARRSRARTEREKRQRRSVKRERV